MPQFGEGGAVSVGTLTAGVALAGGGDMASDVTVDFDLTELVELTTPAPDADYIALYANSVAAHRKALLQNLTNPKVLDVTNTRSAVVLNTTTETTLYTLSVAGGEIGATGALLVYAQFEFLNNSGSASTFTVRAYYGGTVLTAPAPSIGTTANRRSSAYWLYMKNQSATDVQWAGSTLLFNASTNVSRGTAAIDSTVAQDLLLTVQHGTANAAIEAYLDHVRVYRVKEI